VSTTNADLKNATSKSVILAPFNSTLSDESLIYENKKKMQEELQPRKIIKFSAKI
jgi:hypothetical protein